MGIDLMQAGRSKNQHENRVRFSNLACRSVVGSLELKAGTKFQRTACEYACKLLKCCSGFFLPAGNSFLVISPPRVCLYGSQSLGGVCLLPLRRVVALPLQRAFRSPVPSGRGLSPPPPPPREFSSKNLLTYPPNSYRISTIIPTISQRYRERSVSCGTNQFPSFWNRKR